MVVSLFSLMVLMLVVWVVFSYFILVNRVGVLVVVWKCWYSVIVGNECLGFGLVIMVMCIGFILL